MTTIRQELKKIKNDVDKDIGTFYAITNILEKEYAANPTVDRALIFEVVLKNYNISPNWLIKMQKERLQALIIYEF